MTYRIALRPDETGAEVIEGVTPLDDIVVNHVTMFRMEDLGDSWWFCCYLAGSPVPNHRIAFAINKRTNVCTVNEMPDGVDYEGQEVTE